MMPCSNCLSENEKNKMTLKDGSFWSWTVSRPTTLDFIKINEFYCPEITGPVVHEPESIIDCLTPDETGLVPPIFKNRLCDNVNDCPEGEDEGPSSILLIFWS